LDKSFRSKFSRFCCTRLNETLALCWIFSLIFGSLVGTYASSGFLPIDYFSTLREDLPLFLLFLLRIFPLFVCFGAFRISMPILLVCFVFLKGLFFSLTAVYFLSDFGLASLLLTFALLFSDLLSLSVFWFIAIHSFDSCIHMRTVLAAAIVVLFISLFDYLYIAPFMAKLIYF